ncbi:long-chain fatty acid--CoA ligase [Azohydromonas australica]|uniref:long-chain fatty acid--CoA ligase n=1 Tax=Azohydromonas australica TaxID=364039 RepID=UPI000401B109|nr:long-chain fatty acid--CoA ligase [Azohydromonas australica]
MAGQLHFEHWPPGVPRHLTLPQTHLFYNAEVSAQRFPDKPFIVFYDSVLSFARFRDEAEALAGWLQHEVGVKRGDRVLLDLQNSPQWVLAFYAILRADAVVVPVNPMNRCEELRHLVADSGATVAFAGQELLDELRPLLGQGLERVVVATYSDHLTTPTELRVPDFVSAPRAPLDDPRLTAWNGALARGLRPLPMQAGPDDPAVMPYTSGTTGSPKGCVHTHRSVMSTLVGGTTWFSRTQDAVYLAALPFFHVTGLSGSMNGPLYVGATVVVLPRWDRDAAAALMQRYRVTVWQAITAMVVDFVANPRLTEYDLSSLQGIRGGGAAMPEAVAHRLKALTGLDFVEGYGMSETMAATHINPPQRPKPQCLGVPVFDVDARVIDPVTLQELPQGESGEIVVHGPQVMQGYWNNPGANAGAFIEMDGKRFLRTGDLARIDEDGYFFMTDRLKRMINASGYKVWPAEVEALMYRHPAVQEACVIAAPDAKRGETVKAVVVLRPGFEHLTEQDLIDWAHEHMAPYKSPRIVQFVSALPKSGSGKVMWRQLQEAEAGAAGARA